MYSAFDPEFKMDELYHYGRKGMKWYQHIYGPVQSIAKYAKKAGSKISEAKASHDEKKQANFEKKKEQVIRSGDAKTIRKYQNNLTDDELKRAYNRLNNTPKDPDQKQGKEFVKQNSNVSASDMLKKFSDLATNIENTYKAVDKVVGVVNDAKKYTPEERAKAAKIKDIMANMKVKDVIDNPALLSDKQMQDLNNRHSNFTKLKERYEKENTPVKQDVTTPLAAYLKTQESSGKLTSYKKDYKEYERVNNMISSMGSSKGKGKNGGIYATKDDLRNLINEAMEENRNN